MLLNENGDLYCGTKDKFLKIVNLNSNETNPSIKSILTNCGINVLLKIENKLNGFYNGEIVLWDISDDQRPQQVKNISGHSQCNSLFNYL